MNFRILISLIFFFVCTQSFGQVKEKYLVLTKEANSLFKAKEYSQAANIFSESFALGIKPNMDDRYTAAACWALTGNFDSSFSQLLLLAKNPDFIYSDDISNDSSFASLNADVRWKEIINRVNENADRKNSPVELNNFSDSVAYSYGVLEAEKLLNEYGRFKPDVFGAALKETARKNPQIAKADINKIIAKANIEKQKGQIFLKINKTKPGIITTASGLQYKILKQGSGEYSKDTSKISVYYIGKTIDGVGFDSTLAPDKPIVFPLYKLIGGWGEGLKFIKAGGKITLYLPAKLAYGIGGTGDAIPTNAVLIFDVELISVD